EENAAAGLRVDTGTYRLVYLPFDLSQLQEEVVRPLLGSSLLFGSIRISQRRNVVKQVIV
ncbi:MAG: hypothetical protein QF473_35155, partial [Planctomycetota bacterium]|nr:hypothetical protein [Planctomycetota bacterium]